MPTCARGTSHPQPGACSGAFGSDECLRGARRRRSRRDLLRGGSSATVGKDNTVSFDGVRASDRQAGGTAHVRGARRPGPPPPRRRLHRSPRRPSSWGLTMPRASSSGHGRDGDAPGCPRIDEAARVDSRIVPALNTYRPSGRAGGARVPASGRLRLPPAGTPSSRRHLARRDSESGQITCQNGPDNSLVQHAQGAQSGPRGRNRVGSHRGLWRSSRGPVTGSHTKSRPRGRLSFSRRGRPTGGQAPSLR